MSEEQLVNPFSPDNDIWGEVKDFVPTETKDEADFKPLKGSYICIVKKLTHNIGTSQSTQQPYDFYSLQLQVVEVIDGDKGVGRYLNKRYQNTNEKLKALMTDLFTAGITFEKGSREEFDLSLTNAIDKQMRVRAWGWTPEKKMSGEAIAEEDRVAIQQLKIVNDFSKKSKKATSDNVPF